MFAYYLIDPTNPELFVTHEHTRCRQLVTLDPLGGLRFQCAKHKHEPDCQHGFGMVASVAVSENPGGKTGSLILNLLNPGCAELQAVKMDGGDFLPGRVPSLDMYRLEPSLAHLVGAEVQGYVHEDDFLGYLKVFCRSCANGAVHQMAPVKWALACFSHDHSLRIMLRCYGCGGFQVIRIATVDEVAVLHFTR